MKRIFRNSLSLLTGCILSLSPVLSKQDNKNQYFVPDKIPVADYLVDVDIDFGEKLFSGEGTVSFTNTSKKTLHVVAFDYRISDYCKMQVKQSGEVLEVYNPFSESRLNPPLYFILGKPVEAGEEVNLEIEFKKRLFIENEQAEFRSNNGLIPELWWDGLSSCNNYKVKVKDLKGYEIAVSGRLNHETGYYETEKAKDFGFFISSEVKSISSEKNGVQVNVFHPKDDKRVAELALETAVDAIAYYTDMMGSYPYSFINIIPGGNGVYGGYPFASGIVVIHGMSLFEQGSLRHWKWITCHEIGHQYWGESVLKGNDPPWLWIALGIYMDWQYSQESGFSDIKHRGWADMYLRGVKNNYNTIFDLRPDEESLLDFDRNNFVIHAKGFSFVAALESVLGDDIFKEAFRKTYETYKGKRLAWQQYKEICESVSGEDLTWFFDHWVRSNDYLSEDIYYTKSEKTDNGFHSRVVVRYEGPTIMPVPVVATFEDGTSQTAITNRMSNSCIVKFTSNSRLTGATIDPSGVLANLREDIVPEDEQIIDMIRSLSLSNSNYDSYRVFTLARESDHPEDIGDDWFRLGLSLFDAGYMFRSELSFQQGIAYGEDRTKFLSYTWMGILSDINGSRENAKEYYRKALEMDGDYPTSHSQYNLRINREWLKERISEPFNFAEKISGL